MLKDDALFIINSAIKASLPYEQTLNCLKELCFEQNDFTVFSIGKAAIPMAKAACDVLGEKIKTGLAVTKYGHTQGFSSPYFEVIEAAHPVSDQNSILAAQRAVEIAEGLTENDTVIVLLSGGGSALFEKSKIKPELQREITKKLLARGAEIEEINVIRSRLSFVKGGKFAAKCYPAKVITLALSDVLSNSKQAIASGITVKSDVSDEKIKALVKKYLYDVPDTDIKALYENDECLINDGGYFFVGDINSLCDAAVNTAKSLGYTAECVSRQLTGEAREKATEILDFIPFKDGRHAYIFGGETTVTLKGGGKGGRNQEMALSAAISLRDSKNIVFASVGSDGTDGPTDAAGGIADGETYKKMRDGGIFPEDEIDNNNSHFALKTADALVVTGPTGTNVNDITLVLTDL